MDYPSGLKIGGKVYGVQYEPVLKVTSSVRIKNKKVVLKLSRFLRGKQRDDAVRKFLKWAEKRLLKVSSDSFVEPEYKDGGRICTHNKIYDLRVVFEKRNNSRGILTGGIIEIFLDERFVLEERIEKIKFWTEKIIINDQKAYLKEVMAELNQLHFQEDYNMCRFKRMNHRFGSCSSKRNLNISLRLLFAPREVFRYVCVHELAHLREMNHSKRFWALVEVAMPDFKESEKWLRENGFMLG